MDSLSTYLPKNIEYLTSINWSPSNVETSSWGSHSPSLQQPSMESPLPKYPSLIHRPGGGLYQTHTPPYPLPHALHWGAWESQGMEDGHLVQPCYHAPVLDHRSVLEVWSLPRGGKGLRIWIKLETCYSSQILEWLDVDTEFLSHTFGLPYSLCK